MCVLVPIVEYFHLNIIADMEKYDRFYYTPTDGGIGVLMRNMKYVLVK